MLRLPDDPLGFALKSGKFADLHDLHIWSDPDTKFEAAITVY
jgi:hypothetical protein